jgi:hypothetical protein
VGDRLTLLDAEDGARAGGTGFLASIVAISGESITLDRPVPLDWSARRTLVCQRRLFLYQMQLRRRDDLMNHLFRLSVELRVSALLDEEIGEITAPAVEVVAVDVRDRARLVEEADELRTTSPRPAQGAPRVAAPIQPGPDPAAATLT